MKINLIFSFAIFFFNSIVFGQDFLGEVYNLNFSYSHPSGQATSKFFNFKNHYYDSLTKFDIELQGGALTIDTPNELIIIDKLPKDIEDIEKINMTNFNAESSKQELKLSISKIGVEASKKEVLLDKTLLNCQYLNNYEDFTDIVLDSCLNKKGVLNLNRINIDGKNQATDLKMSISKNKMKFEVKYKGQKVKGSGKTYFEGDKIKIKIEKAKIGFLSIKGQLFKALKSSSSSKVKVNEPWIIIEID